MASGAAGVDTSISGGSTRHDARHLVRAQKTRSTELDAEVSRRSLSLPQFGQKPRAKYFIGTK
jgi:hypothetical protein